MSVIEFVASDLFVIRTIKYLLANPDNKWVNSYEFTALDDGDNTVLITLANAVVNYEAALHSNLVAFDHVTVSTWVDDHVPYDPASFLSIPLTQVGLRSEIGIDLLALGLALRVNRVPISGRYGNLFYRGALYENEIYAPAGIPVLNDAGDTQAIMDAAITSSGLTDFVGASATGGLAMSMIDATGAIIRRVDSLIASGVSLIKQDHQWFNRTP